MQYQLVVQVKGISSDDFNRLVSWEDALAEYLAASVVVDGHDLGAGEFNVFIFTDDPLATFRNVQKFLETRPLPRSMAAAYRHRKRDDYVILWPPESTHFDIA